MASLIHGLWRLVMASWFSVCAYLIVREHEAAGRGAGVAIVAGVVVFLAIWVVDDVSERRMAQRAELARKRQIVADERLRQEVRDAVQPCGGTQAAAPQTDTGSSSRSGRGFPAGLVALGVLFGIPLLVSLIK